LLSGLLGRARGGVYCLFGSNFGAGKLFVQTGDFTPLPEQRGNRSRHPHQGTNGESHQNDEHQRQRPLPAEKEMQVHDVVVLDREAEQQNEQDETDEPDERTHGSYYLQAHDKKKGSPSCLPGFKRMKATTDAPSFTLK